MKGKISKYYLGFFMIILLMFLGSMHTILTYMALIGTAIVAIFIGNSYLKNPNEDLCVGIICLLVFQNLCIGMGAHIAGNTSSSLKYITQIPFFTIAIIWVIIQLRYYKDGKYGVDICKKSFIFLVFCILFSLILGRGNIQAILVNIRNLTVFYMAFEIGKYNLSNEQNIKMFVRRFLKIAAFVFIVGIVILEFGYEAYKIIGIHEVYIAKGSALTSESLGGRFYTTLIKKQYLRMGSIYYEPVNLAYFFASALLMSIFCDWTKYRMNKIIMTCIMGFGLLLTFGKGGYLLVGTTFLCLIIQKLLESFLKKMKPRTILKITIFIIIICVSAFCIYYYKNVGAAVSPHFWGVIKTFNSVKAKPYGYGLGTGGNAAQLFNENAQSWFETGGETALMSFMYQIGIQGVIALVICMYNISINDIDRDTGYFYRLFSFLPIILIGISLLQDNTFSPQCIVPFMLLQGGAKEIFEKKYPRNKDIKQRGNTRKIQTTSMISKNNLKMERNIYE